MKRNLVVVGVLFLIIGVGCFIYNKIQKTSAINIELIPTSTPTVVLAKPTVKPLSFEEMNKLYGPCTKVNVLTYHHIEDEEAAKKNGRSNLSVSPDFFRKHLQYLKDKNYNVISTVELIKFFDENLKLPLKPVILTFDDAYEDNYLNMFPILKEFGYKATIFTPTGLVNNLEYLNWGQIQDMKNSGLIYFANHTWSHHSSSGNKDVLSKEISLADKQLSEKDLNNIKIFSYPFGNPSVNAEQILNDLGYKIAFTTRYGVQMCKGQRLELPRIRVGNAPLNSYGLY